MEYLPELRVAIRANHGCDAVHAATVPVTETFRGQVAWQGSVEVFDLVGHRKALRCYAWGHPVDKGPREITTVLEIPPVTSPQTAVKAAIVAQSAQR